MKKKSRRGSQVIDLAEAREKRRSKREAGAQKKNDKLERLQKAKPALSDRQANKTFRRRYMVAGVALFVFLVLGISMFNIVNLKMQQAEAMELQEQLLSRKERLKTELSLVHSPAYIEQQARTQLKMVKPGETLYIFPEETDKGDEAGAAAGEESAE